MRTVSTYTCLTFLLILLFQGMAFADQIEEGKIGRTGETTVKATKKGIFKIEIPDQGGSLAMGVNDIRLVVRDRGGKALPGAKVKVKPWMPEMGHGVGRQPVVTERGEGNYLVENIILIMTGHWTLEVEVEHEGLVDRAVFDFPHVTASHHHIEEAASGGLENLDTSRTRSSEKELFRVSYESGIGSLTYNRFLTLTLRVETLDGRAVENASISIYGDMPAHGHGLPSEPEVTREEGGGKYIVEGLKFSMPGWWVVKFHIKASGIEDDVSFNLILN